MDYDKFDTDDNVTVLLLKRMKTLELYCIKWIFDFSKMNIPKLKKLDEQILGLDMDKDPQAANEGPSSNR